MENQHRLVKGYRELNQSEIDAVNSIKLAEQDIGQLFQQVRAIRGVDQRALAITKGKLQEAFSWFVRAVAQPLDVYELELPKPEPETFITRLEAERDQTKERLDKLNAFIGSDAFNMLGDEAKEDLVLQAKAMTQLTFILSKRYDDITLSNKS